MTMESTAVRNAEPKAADFEPPRIEDYGTLAELTAGVRTARKPTGSVPSETAEAVTPDSPIASLSVEGGMRRRDSGALL